MIWCGYLPIVAQNFPEPKEGYYFIHDYTGFLDKGSQNYLENRLRKLEKQTGVEVAIIVTGDLQGLEPADYAQQIGEYWGVGKAKDDNGIVILVKPKTATEKGEVFLATGYGMEAVVTDAAARKIVDDEITPEFKKGEYWQGLNVAITKIEGLVTGEFTAEDYAGEGSFPIDLLLYVIGGLVVIVGGAIWLSLKFGGRSRSSRYRGSYSSHSSGSSSSSSSYSGYGGGSYGGGGAGGSW
jgi:uncharacterized protein